MTDEELYALLRNGDAQALDAVMAKYTRLLWNIAGAILRNIGTNEDIEECISDVFIELWRKPGNWDPERGGLQTYLALLIKREALNRAKRLRRIPALSLNEEIAQRGDVMQEVLSMESGTEAITAVDELPEPDREIFIRRHLLGQKPDDIARSMKLPVRQITNRLYRSKGKLKTQLQALEQI